MPKPLPVAVIEAKAEIEDPLKGMQQAKGYADCTRFQVHYVFATNGHLYGEFNITNQMPGGPFPFADFPSHDDLTARYAKDSGIDVTTPQAAMLFMPDSTAFPRHGITRMLRSGQPLRKFFNASKVESWPVSYSA